MRAEKHWYGCIVLLQTPLHLAAKGGYWQCMDVLLEYGAKLNVEDMQRRTPRDHIRGRPKCTLVVTHHIGECILLLSICSMFICV